MIKLSVVICTYNPKRETLKKVIQALKEQTLPQQAWELLLVDNCSARPIGDWVNLSWHSKAKIIIEKIPGLSHARIAGVKASGSPLIVFVDDDNVLDKDYLKAALNFSAIHPEVGCFGGRSLPVFSTEPPEWFQATGINLGCQDYGSYNHISNYKQQKFQVTAYPEKAPIGTGMVILKKAFLLYLEEAATNPERMKLGRRGASLSSGEDNDIILTIVKKGFEIAYVPELVVHHLIPEARYTKDYLKRMAFESNRTWVKVLEIHGINPHKKIKNWTLLPRTVKSYFANRAWSSSLAGIRFMSSYGTFKGLSEL